MVPTDPPRRAALAALLFLAGSGSGCAPPPYDLALSWVFVDGRDCADAGVADVALRVGEQESVARCSAGQQGRAVTLPQAPPRELLRAAALSPAGAVLYRGAEQVPDEAGPLQLTLYFTGGQ